MKANTSLVAAGAGLVGPAAPASLGLVGPAAPASLGLVANTSLVAAGAGLVADANTASARFEANGNTKKAGQVGSAAHP